MDMVKVAIADDHPGIRRGVRRVLEKFPEVIVVGEAEDGQKAIEVVEAAAPHMLILDVQMPVMDGIEVLNVLSERQANIRVIVLSAIDDPVFEKETLSLGACCYLSKTEIRQLIEVVREIVEGDCPCDPREDGDPAAHRSRAGNC